MIRALMFLIVFGFAYSLKADSVSVMDAATPVPTAVAATPAPTPEKETQLETLAPPWDQVTLKDGQKAEGKIRGYDAYFLEFTAKNATRFHIPWDEVGEVKTAEFSGDTALMRQYMKRGSVDVSTRIAPKRAGDAAFAALWPGFFIHGYGFKEAGNGEMFLSLAGAELFGMLVGGFGAIRAGDKTLSQGEKDSATSLAIGGASVFALTWVIDLIGAPISAGNYNERHGLTLGAAPQNGGAQAFASLRF